MATNPPDKQKSYQAKYLAKPGKLELRRKGTARWKTQNKEKVNASNRAYRDTNPDRVKKWREDNATSNRKSYLKTTYGITPEEYDAMFEKQEGRCAICGEHQSSLKKRLYVDHDHRTGKFRGLLCHHCNVSLGHMKDDPKLLYNAINYLA